LKELQFLRVYFLIIFYRLKFPELEVRLCNLEIAYILLLAQTVLDQGKCEYCYRFYTATIFIQLKNTLHKAIFISHFSIPVLGQYVSSFQLGKGKMAFRAV
jgi:hypothetical protein